jgi:hypothetical protein
VLASLTAASIAQLASRNDTAFSKSRCSKQKNDPHVSEQTKEMQSFFDSVPPLVYVVLVGLCWGCTNPLYVDYVRLTIMPLHTKGLGTHLPRLLSVTG